MIAQLISCHRIRCHRIPQPLPGYCLLLADPVVESLNSLDESGRAIYCRDMARIGDALLEATDAVRINYETWGNSEPALHTHIVPRYLSEPEDRRRRPACMGYDWPTARRFDPNLDAPLIARMRALLP